MKKILCCLLIVFILTGCSSEVNDVPELLYQTIEEIVSSNIFSNRDLRDEVDLTDAVYVNLDEYNSDYTIDKEDIYVLSGTFTNQIIINATKDDKVQLVLNNVNITNDSCAAINVISADKVFITNQADTINNLQSNSFTDKDINGVIYSKDDLTINGYGTLNITTAKHGIVGNDDVVLAQSTFNINASNRGVDANDSVRIYNGTYNITSGKDAIKADEDDEEKGFIYINDGIFNINSLEDGFAASGIMEIKNGEFNITTGGGFKEVLNDLTVGEGSGGVTQPTDLLEYTMQCFRCNGILIEDGEFNLSSYEDVFHSNDYLVINGGDFEIISGDDAVHADNQILITDCNLSITNCYEGIEADFITITGGTISIIGYDDGINVSSSSGVLTITGGNIYVSTQGDCIDSNGDFLMTGGSLVLESNAIYTMGDGALDISGTISVSGGTIKDENGNDISTSNSSSNSNRPGRK